MTVLLKSNEFWGRRSGTVHKDGSNAFIQTQYGVGRTNDGKGSPKRFRWPMKRRLMGAGNLRKGKA